MICPEGEFWYVLHTKPQQELRARDTLTAKGIEVFVPLKKIIKKEKNGVINGRQKFRTTEMVIPHPSFRRFIICYADMETVIKSQTAYYVINTTPGIAGMVGINNKALVMDNDAIAEFLCVMDHNFFVVDSLLRAPGEETGLFKKGDQVEIATDAMSGYVGTFESYYNAGTAEVLIAQITALTGKPLKIDTNFIRLIES